MIWLRMILLVVMLHMLKAQAGFKRLFGQRELKVVFLSVFGVMVVALIAPGLVPPVSSRTGPRNKIFKEHVPKEHDAHKDHDHTQAVFQWLPTICWKKKEWKEEPCNVYRAEFSLHGLWPADSTGKNINNCRNPYGEFKDRRIDFNYVYNSVPESGRLWPNYKTGKTAEEQWFYEFTKHGVCGNLSPKKYFEGAVYIIKEFKDDLRKFCMPPNDHEDYTRVDIANEVGRIIHGAPHNLNAYISCRILNTSHVKLLEFHLCFDKEEKPNLIPCPPLEAKDNKNCALRKKNCHPRENQAA